MIAPVPGGNRADPPTPAVIDLEIQLLLDAVNRVAGHDFRDYAPAMLRRRVLDRVRAEGASTISGLLERVLHVPGTMDRLVDAVTFNPSAPFRDPLFFEQFQRSVLPRLRTFPHARFWVAGCGAADDAYALAILAREAELEGRVRIYATDASDVALTRARTGAVGTQALDDIETRYAASGGKRRFADYVEGGSYRDALRENIVFAQHNLATDGSFNEFHLIVMRQTLMKYNRTLTYRAHQVVYESLVRLGVLGVGSKETLRFTPHERAYEPVPETDVFYRRLR